MNIFVCLKQVPARDSLIRVNTAGDWIDDGDLSFEMNEPDAFALEEGLRLKEKHGGEVVAVTAGPARSASTIREALAKGADRGILIEDDRFAQSDALATAGALAAALSKEKHDLVLTGLQSDDAGFGQVGVILAELLGLPHGTIIMEVVAEGIMEVSAEGSSIRVKRELEAGWFQHVEMPLPALLTIQSGINKVRYATLIGIKKAKSKPLQRYTPQDLGVELASRQSIRRLYAPKSAKQTQFLEGSPKEAAAKLLEKLRFEARVL
ncbi:MAG: electron transfer flavoprotein subunit beta/FixA family protein [Bryobacterales bacterium]